MDEGGTPLSCKPMAALMLSTLASSAVPLVLVVVGARSPSTPAPPVGPVVVPTRCILGVCGRRMGVQV